MSRKIKLSLTGLKPESLVAKAQNIVSKMTGNSNFPQPTPTLARISTATDELSEAIMAANTGARVAILERNEKAETLRNLLRQLASYISLIGNGDGAILASSGFELQRIPEPTPPVTRPVDFTATREEQEGMVRLSWKSVRGAKSYIVEVTTNDPTVPGAVWTMAMVSSKVKVTMTNLTPGQYYWYRVKAVGSKNESAYSDVSLIMAA